MGVVRRIMLRIGEERLVARLEELAREHGRSMNMEVVEAVKAWVERHAGKGTS